MSTYEKLGQYAGSELPASPTDVTLVLADNTSIQLSWTNANSSYFDGNVVMQTWESTYWLTNGEPLQYDADGGSLVGLSEGTSYRIRVAFLLFGVLYPSNPFTQATTAIPKPVITESGATTNEIGVDISNYDVSWTALKMYYMGVSTGYEWVLADTIAGDASSYTYTGLTGNEEYQLYAAAVIDGQDYAGYNIGVETQAEPLTAPTDLSYNLATDTLQFFWTNHNSEIGSGNNLIRVNDSQVQSVAWDAEDNGVGGWCCLGSAFQYNTEYTLVIRYQRGVGDYVDSTGLTFMIEANYAPQGLNVTEVTTDYIHIEWTNPVAELDSIVVYLDDNYYDEIGGGETVYDYTGLSSDTEYKLTIAGKKSDIEYPCENPSEVYQTTQA